MKRLLSVLLLVFAFSYLGFAADVTLDMFEYATDDSAQAEYVSSDVYSSDKIPTMTSNTAPSGVASADVENDANHAAYKGMDDENASEVCWHSDNSALPHWLQYQFTSGKTIQRYAITSRNYALCNNFYPVDWTVLGSNTGSFGGEEVTLDTQTGQSFTQNEKKTYSFSNSASYTYYRLHITNTETVQTYSTIGEWELMEINLQCYSESTIKQQGTYSLKGVAVITDSLNDTLTRTVDPTIDLTDKTSIKYDIYSTDRTGSQIKIGIHDSGGTTTEHTANISSTGAWETQTWDISAVTNANKDDIDSIIVTILNADAANTFYIDYMYGAEAEEAENPTPAQLLIGGMWFKDGVLQHSDFTRHKRGTAE